MKRCAIYTRKSAEERRAKDLSTLENQRAFCSTYIASQAGEGWVEAPELYDDGGWSGGSLRRPALARLRAEIEAGRIDTIVVYKIDRLTRSLRDFVMLVEEFERAGARFVSVTQSFDTSSSMGRLTLNVLLSFAQFEREMTGERLRDWFAGARAKGLWVPRRPFGYVKVDGNNLVPDPVEAVVVRRIFRRYCATASCRRVADELIADGIRQASGGHWTGSMVLHTIKHRVYRGELVHRRAPLPGNHEPIVSERLWRKAQAIYLGSKWRRRSRERSPVAATLKGFLFDREGMRMHHTFLRSKGRLYRYYVAGAEARRYGRGADAYMRFRADDLEASVLDVACRLTGQEWPRGASRSDVSDFFARHLDRVDVGLEEMRVSFRTGAVISAAAGGRLGPRRGQLRP